MSLLLCRQAEVRHPYFMESLGIHLYSFQELSYVIYHHPLLVMDGFVEENLFVFLRDELNQGFLALKLERWLKSSENPDETLTLILQECGYCTSAEIMKFRQQIDAFRKKHPAELAKLKADEIFGLRQYGRAAELYQELLEYPSDSYVNDSFRGRIWNNLASCYARMYHLEQAFDAYEKAYLRLSEERILEELYQLTKIDSRLKLGERLNNLMTDELRASCDEKRRLAEENAAKSEQVGELELLFRQEAAKRQEGEKELLRKWKQEYRSMV